MITGLVLAAFIGAEGALTQDQDFDSDGVKIHYVVRGVGQPVLLIHGFTANIGMQWGLPGILELLSKDYQVIAMDCRGHGKSDKPHDPSAYGAAMADDAIRLLDHLKVKKCLVVGYSMGGRIVARLITTHPDRFVAAVISGNGVTGEESRLAPYQNKLAESLERGDGIGPLLEALTPPDRPKPTGDRLGNLSKIYLRNQDQKALAAVVRGMPGLFVESERLKKNELPVLALIGADDPIKVKAEAMSKLMPHCELVVVPGTHLTAYGKKEFRDALQKFLADHKSK